MHTKDYYYKKITNYWHSQQQGWVSKHYPEQEMSDTKEYTPHDSIYMRP